MEYKVDTLVFDNGERYPILMGVNEMPHFYTTLWVTAKLRSPMAVNTIISRLGAVNWFLQWEKIEGRDLYSEFKCGKFLDAKDIDSIKSHLAIDVAHLKGISKKKNTRNKVVNINDVPQLIKVTPSVGRNHQYNRMTSVAEYIDFLAGVAVQFHNNPQLISAISRMLKMFKAARPKGKSKNVIDRHDSKKLPDGLIDEFIGVAHYNHPLNPFRHEITKRRNHLMFVLLKELGIRRGELLSLTISNGNMDLIGDAPYIWVKREHDNKYDPRKPQPVAKTKERMLRVSKKTALLIDEYICLYRSRTPNANKHPYLFVTHLKCKTQGQPLSISTLDTIIIPAMKAVDERFSAIHAHYFRHHWNEDFSIKIDTINALAEKGVGNHQSIDSGKEAKMRQHLMGHSSEKSADPYNRRHIKKRAGEVILQEQEELQQQLAESNNK